MSAESPSVALPLPVAGRARRRRAPLAPYAWAAGAAALVLATNLLDFGADHRHIALLDASAEWSWSHIAATIAFASGAVGGAIGARRAPDAGRRRAWTAAAAIFAFLLVDNVTRLHTHVSFWPVLYAPLLAVLSASLWRVARGTPRAPQVALGLLTLFASIGIHVLGPAVVHGLGWTDRSWAYQVKVGLKEGTELAGWVLSVPAVWALARSRG